MTSLLKSAFTYPGVFQPALIQKLTLPQIGTAVCVDVVDIYLRCIAKQEQMQRLDVENVQSGQDDDESPMSYLDRLLRNVSSVLPARWKRDRGGFARLEQDEGLTDLPSRPSGISRHHATYHFCL